MPQHANLSFLKMDIQKAKKILQSGGLLVYPTETYYAIGCLANNCSAIQAIYRIKERSFGKTLPLIAASLEQAGQMAELSCFPQELLANFWPGPLTVIAKARTALPHELLDKEGNIALRVSSEPIARELADIYPVIATSANLSGIEPQKNSAHLAPQFLESIVSAGLPCGIIEKNINGSYSAPSTIVKAFSDSNGKKKIKILRSGCIPHSAFDQRFL